MLACGSISGPAQVNKHSDVPPKAEKRWPSWSAWASYALHGVCKCQHPGTHIRVNMHSGMPTRYRTDQLFTTYARLRNPDIQCVLQSVYGRVVTDPQIAWAPYFASVLQDSIWTRMRRGPLSRARPTWPLCPPGSLQPWLN